MVLGITKNDKKASIVIIGFSMVVFVLVTALERVTLPIELPFDEHIFALANAVINSAVAVLLFAGLITARRGQYSVHKKIMLTALVLSILFLVSYILHHLFAGSTFYGDTNRDGIVSDAEKAAAGGMRWVYFILLGTHILLAGISLPYILFTVYRALIGENTAHRKLAKIAWPMWFYVAVTGPIVYLMISRFY